MLIIRVSRVIVSGITALCPACVNILVTQGGIKETQSADGRPRASLSIVTPAGGDIDLMLPHKTETVARPGTVN